jgi:hypothetical protein
MMKKEIKMNNILNSNTLLGTFIKNKIKNYTPPTREGTPKGKAIGFPLNKFKASLFFLTRLTLKEIAGNAGVSYGLLRKWTTEKKFIILVHKHCSEFVSLNVKNNGDRVIKQDNLEKKHLKKSLKEFAKEPQSVLNLDEYKDIGLYSDFLLKEIAKTMASICMRMDNPAAEVKKGFDMLTIMKRAYQADYVLMLIKEVADTPSSQRNYAVFNMAPKATWQPSKVETATIRIGGLKHVETLLTQSHLTNKDRKLAITLISNIRRGLEQGKENVLLKKAKHIAKELGYKIEKIKK